MTSTLPPADIVGGSFWLLSIAMIAATFFFFAERSRVGEKWRTSITLVGVVMVIAAVQYYYLRDMWVTAGQAPLVLRYLDWALSRPIQVVSIFVFVSAIASLSTALFWRLLVGALVTIVAEFLGSAGYMSATLGFLIGMVGWLYVLGELHFGEASAAVANGGNARLQMAFTSLRLIVTIGWAIYPLGYFMQHLGGGVDVNALNVIYNFADILNKLIFGMVIYRAAIDIGEAGRNP